MTSNTTFFALSFLSIFALVFAQIRKKWKFFIQILGNCYIILKKKLNYQGIRLFLYSSYIAWLLAINIFFLCAIRPFFGQNDWNWKKNLKNFWAWFEIWYCLKNQYRRSAYLVKQDKSTYSALMLLITVPDVILIYRKTIWTTKATVFSYLWTHVCICIHVETETYNQYIILF